MMSKAIVLAVCQFLAHTELVSEGQPQYYHATIDYGYDADCVYYDTQTGRERPCNEWENDMMDGAEQEELEVDWDREVSGEGEMRFNPETGRWTWEGPMYEIEDLRYVAGEEELEEEETPLYFAGEEEEETTVWMTEPQDTWVEMEPQFRYFSSSVKPVGGEEEGEEEEQVNTFRMRRENKIDDIKNQFDRLLKKGYLKNSPVLEDLMNGKFDYLLSGPQEDGMKDYCAGEPLSQVYYQCVEWNQEDTIEKHLDSKKPAPWSLAKVMKPLASPRNKPAYHTVETSTSTDEGSEDQSSRVLFRHAGKTYDVVTVDDIVVRDFGDEEQGEEGWYDDDGDEYNYVY